MKRIRRHSIASTATISSTTNSSVGVHASPKRRGRRTKKPKPSYKFDTFYTEDHGMVIYDATFNNNLSSDRPPIFATVGSNRCTVYECPPTGGLSLLLCYSDPDPEEAFYTCAWTYHTRTRSNLLATGGQRGVIRIIDISQNKSICNLIGHGGAINQIKIHPIHAYLLLSCSKDYGIRLWNVETHILIAIFSGVDGHRAEVLSIDFDLRGERIISSGMDHALKLWKLNTNEMQTIIQRSIKAQKELSFPTIKQHYPNFSSRDIHGNYVDCVQWFGDFIISKSCQNAIVIWRIGTEIVKPASKARRSSNDIKPDMIVQFKCLSCELWFVRFDFNIWNKVLAVGNQHGKIYVWELEPDSPEANAYSLTNRNCKANVRDVAFSKNAGILIAVCDDGTIWRWNRKS